MGEPYTTTENFEERRREIVDIAAKLFARNGYAATGVVELSRAAGLAKGSLYYYIGSKEALLPEIHERVMGPLIEDARYVLALDARPEVRLRLLSEVLLRAIVSRLDHVWVFLHEHRALRGDHLQQFRVRRREFEDLLTELLEEGVADGSFRIEDVRLTTLAFLGLHNYTYQWVRPDGRYGAEELSAHYCRLFLEGIAGPDVDVDVLESDVQALRDTLPNSFGP